MSVRTLLLITIYSLVLGGVPDAVRAADVNMPIYLQRVTTAREALVQAQTLPDPQAREKLGRVLSDRAFHEAEPNVVQKQAIRFQSWVGAQLRHLFRPLRRVPPPPNAPANTPGAGPAARLLAFLGSPLLLIILALAFIAVIAFFVARRLRRRAVKLAAVAAPPRTAAEWRHAADTLAAQGDYRAAVRALFLGTLTELDERRLVAFDPALTDREYVREAQRQQWWLVEPLRPFVRLVESIVYADAPCHAAEYARARAFTDDLRRITGGQGLAA